MKAPVASEKALENNCTMIFQILHPYSSFFWTIRLRLTSQLHDSYIKKVRRKTLQITVTLQ